MRLGRLLESKGGLAMVAPVRMAAGQQGGFGNPHAIFILTELHFREWKIITDTKQPLLRRT
jgi:hypothetical protein